MKNKGSQLWEKAKTIIPGGNQLLSKRSERFLPELWPAYYAKAKGCEVWDLDGNKYYDFAQMGVGACVLGYADDDVNLAVINAVNSGSMCTLNCPEEVKLAEKLIELHPWADMARFARTGGEACAIAIRIARAATGRSRVAFCGYHGWSDWYLAANISDSSNLDGQLLPGLQPKGVPRELHGTALPFGYNRLDELEQLIAQFGNEIGAIMMEPQRGTEPKEGFLEGVRKIASKNGLVLIFDEVTSGFRINLGGIHLTTGVEPDVAVFGKALGNGYPVSAIIGRREVMDSAQDSFISSTFWSEKIGYASAVATLDKMERNNVQAELIKYGNLIQSGWEKIGGNSGLKLNISGIPPLLHLEFAEPNPLEMQTLYTQEMLDRGYLLGASVYTTYAYSEEIIDRFINDSSEVFKQLKSALDSNSLKNQLKANTIHAGFKRLT